MEQIFIDIHTHHLLSPSLEVKSILNIELNKDSIDSISDNITAGLHPWFINESRPLEGILLLEELLENQKILAVGECGLDKIISTDLSVQQEVFREQIRLAHDYRKPLIIHCVRAYEEVLLCLKDERFDGKVIFHGFNKNKKLADSLIAKGYYLSFGKAILNGRLDELLINIPIGYLFLETDDSSIKIQELYDYVAKVKNISLDLLKEKIKENYQLVFE